MSERTKPRLFVFLCAIALAGITVATSAGALGQSTPSSVTTATTLPSGDDPVDGELDAMRPAVEQYAAAYGLSFDEAVAELQAEARLTQYADSLRGKDGYAGFKVEHTDGGVRGVLALTDVSLATPPPDLPMRVVSARVAEQDQVSLSERLTADLKATWSQVAATTYDPFDDTVTIWRTPGQGWKASDDSDIADRVRGLLGSAFAGARVRFDEPLTAETFYGGQRESKSSSFLFFTWTSAECTSAFGVSKYISGSWRYGYITAGHCRAFGGTGWKVHRGGTTYTVQAYHDQLLGGYRDRVVFEAGGSSWLVQVAPSSTQDMLSTPTHLYQGSFYCHYGAKSNDQDCSTLAAVSVVVQDGGYTFYTFQGGSGATCIAGDSGGPVWKPNYPYSSIPAGTIEAGNSQGTICLYLALDDQLSGSGWSLQ